MAMNPQGPSRIGALPPRFKELMKGCSQMACGYLSPFLQIALDNANKALHEFAEKAEDASIKRVLFEGKRKLENKRDEIEQVFFKSIDTVFQDYITGTSTTQSGFSPFGDIKMSQLKLVDKGEVEVMLPVQNMVAKANANCIDQLYGLKQRLAVINGGNQLSDDALPGGPECIANAARNAFSCADLDVKSGTVIYTVFDRYVMRELEELYQKYNQTLVEAGVLPNLRYQILKQNNSRARTKHDGQVEGGSPAKTPSKYHGISSVGEETFQEILEMMVRTRASRGAMTDAVSEVVAAGSRVTILNTLTDIQNEYSNVAGNIDTRFRDEKMSTGPAEFVGRLRSALVEERTRIYRGVDRRRVAGVDADIIELVGMLFEYMLQDEQLPNIAKALLSRLHTPFLKMAILNRTLFADKDHPGRKILELMVDAGCRWVVEDELERGIYPAMRSAVERILRELKDDLSILDEILSDFYAQMQAIEQKSNIIEQRTIQAADGQARLISARARANAEIQACMSQKHMAADAYVFMTKVWVEKLTFILLREHNAEESAAWRLALQLARDLAWSLSRQANQAERDKVHDSLPRLRAELRAGLELLHAYGRHDDDRMFAQICAWQDDALTFHNVDVFRETIVLSDDVPEKKEKITIITDEWSREVRLAIDMLDELDFYTWFEFAATDETPLRRLKLAWYSTVSTNYMFVDAMGVKVIEYTKVDLARMICAGKARILMTQEKPFLDRAFDAIKGLLRKNDVELTR